MLGFSIYLDHELTADDYNYLIAMRNAGFTQIFTSLLIKEDAEVIKKRLAELVKWCQNLDLKISAAVSQDSLNKMGVDLADVGQIQGLGINAVKVTAETSNQIIAKLSKSLVVSVSAGIITIDKLADLKEYNANFDNLIAGYGYYPRANTGIDTQWFKAKNEWLHEQKLKVGAFIAGDILHKGEDGRTTLEQERGQAAFAAMLELHRLDCDNVFIGDAAIRSEAMESFTNYLKKKAITLHLDQDVDLLLSNSWHNQFRIEQDVVSLKHDDVLTSLPTGKMQARQKGTITVTNEKYGAFQGEFEVDKHNLPADDRIDVIANVVQSDLPLLDFIKPGQQVIFAKAN